MANYVFGYDILRFEAAVKQVSAKVLAVKRNDPHGVLVETNRDLTDAEKDAITTIMKTDGRRLVKEN